MENTPILEKRKDGFLIYDLEYLSTLNKSDILTKIDQVKNGGLTLEEKKLNLERLYIALNGGNKFPTAAVLKDIQDGMADIDDMGGN